MTWPTSYEALVGRADVQPGEWVLVHAAAGGVGLLAVQIAKGQSCVHPALSFFSCHAVLTRLLAWRIALGAKVIATAGSAEKLEVSKKYGGADYAINYRDEGWQKEVMKITGGHGVGELLSSFSSILLEAGLLT